MRTWTDEEIKFLRKAYNNESVGKLATLLGRSEQSIRNKVHILRKKGYTFDRVTDAKH
jgi:biotin operon repressor